MCKVDPLDLPALERLVCENRIAITRDEDEAAEVRRVIEQLAREDANRGKPLHGRAGRISRRLAGIVSEHRVRRWLRKII
jgi:hypothetical protein